MSRQLQARVARDFREAQGVQKQSSKESLTAKASKSEVLLSASGRPWVDQARAESGPGCFSAVGTLRTVEKFALPDVSAAEATAPVCLFPLSQHIARSPGPSAPCRLGFRVLHWQDPDTAKQLGHPKRQKAKLAQEEHAGTNPSALPKPKQQKVSTSKVLGRSSLSPLVFDIWARYAQAEPQGRMEPFRGPAEQARPGGVSWKSTQRSGDFPSKV